MTQIHLSTIDVEVQPATLVHFNHLIKGRQDYILICQVTFLHLA